MAAQPQHELNSLPHNNFPSPTIFYRDITGFGPVHRWNAPYVEAIDYDIVTPGTDPIIRGYGADYVGIYEHNKAIKGVSVFIPLEDKTMQRLNSWYHHKPLSRLSDNDCNIWQAPDANGQAQLRFWCDGNKIFRTSRSNWIKSQYRSRPHNAVLHFLVFPVTDMPLSAFEQLLENIPKLPCTIAASGETVHKEWQQWADGFDASILREETKILARFLQSSLPVLTPNLRYYALSCVYAIREGDFVMEDLRPYPSSSSCSLDTWRVGQAQIIYHLTNAVAVMCAIKKANGESLRPMQTSAAYLADLLEKWYGEDVFPGYDWEESHVFGAVIRIEQGMKLSINQVYFQAKIIWAGRDGKKNFKADDDVLLYPQDGVEIGQLYEIDDPEYRLIPVPRGQSLMSL
ncbi:hypothetical protein HK097_007294 [Rhizophlyctis rosea]|uniref:Uncharacterized protein n=1 Tax=Rhizophlyctis rosea TaxID=64517 RepID=A0AAD5X5Z4_9FUNG|nr:hypothetical protein HK097_007294 [Rhizophlyctis rosea]